MQKNISFIIEKVKKYLKCPALRVIDLGLALHSFSPRHTFNFVRLQPV